MYQRENKRPHVSLEPKDWELIEREASRRYLTISGLISQIVAEWCDGVESRRAEKIKSQATAMFNRGLAEVDPQ
jgi:hypothetical protein